MTEEKKPADNHDTPEENKAAEDTAENKQQASDRVSTAKSANSEYVGDDLKHLSDLEHVRERPSMYIGDTTVGGLHHLVYEVVDNSIDEAMAGFASAIRVTINVDGSVTVYDDGRGIPPDVHEQLSAEMEREVSTIEGVMTVLKFGGKFEKGAYQTSGGLHGVGVTVVNFLSEWAEVEVCRDGNVYQQEYERGEPTGPVVNVGTTKKRGTKTTFKPDPQIFPIVKFEYATLYKRLHELSFLNKGIRIIFKDERNGEGDEFYAERGIIEFVEYLNRSSDALHSDVIYIDGEQDGVEYEIAMQYAAEYTENVNSFVNNICTYEGGTHVSGFRSALTRTLNTYGKKNNMFRDLTLTGDDFREGLTAVISLRVGEPQFEGQTKTKLGNNEVEGIVSSVLGDSLSKYLEENPRSAKAILRKCLLAAEAREAAKKARELVKRKSVLGGGGLPGKLRDCLSNDMEKCELYLVEGDSAGGSAEGGRLKEFQAILPLRGKIINAYKAREDKVLANEEVQSMISAIRIGIGADQDVSKRRYNKIIIMTDADVDGSHIRTLLLCFFYRQMFHLIAGGHVYVAQPPLFRVKSGRTTYYVQTEEEMKGKLLARGLGDSVFDPGNGDLIEGERMEKLCKTLSSMEDSLIALERRGVSLKVHSLRLNPENNKLPVFHVFVGTNEEWFTTRLEMDNYIKEQEKKLGRKLLVEDEDEIEESDTAADSESNGEATSDTTEEVRLTITEFHEVKSINNGLKDLLEMGFTIDALLPEERTGIEEPRYILRRGENELPIEDLRGLLAAVRAAGEKGLQVTRFKGLGEMNAEELRETSLDPENRTILQVEMADVGAADDMFRVLMGDKVEPRRDFIEKHALEVRDLDI